MHAQQVQAQIFNRALDEIFLVIKEQYYYIPTQAICHSVRNCNYCFQMVTMPHWPYHCCLAFSMGFAFSLFIMADAINFIYQYHHTIFKLICLVCSGMLTETSLQTKKPKRKGL